MTRETLLEKLRAQADLFRAEGVRHVSLFGSQARGDARPDSDVDLLVEYEPEKAVSLFDLCHLQCELSDRLGSEVQVLKFPIRRDALRRSVEADCVRIL